MGNGDNRNTLKARQRKAWRRKKARVLKKKTAGSAVKLAKKKVAAKPTL